MGELAARTIFSNETGPLAGVGLDTLAKNQAAILELEGAQAPQSRTISNGSISPTASYVIVDTEGAAAADDLTAISNVLSASENLHDGMVIYLRAADSGRVVTVKNSTSANGINTYDGNDYALSPTHWLKLQLRSGKWYEVDDRAMVAALAAATSASAAQSTANTANTTANTAQTTANTASTNASSALTAANSIPPIGGSVAITGATTLTTSAFGKLHICTGTSADYTVTLPAVASSAGKMIAFIVSSAMTKLLTLKGNGSELIRDSNTRIMWAGESATLYCDGTVWHKIAGTTIPMMVTRYLGSNQSIPSSTYTLAQCRQNSVAQCPAAALAANDVFTALRPGNLNISVAYDASGWGSTVSLIGHAYRNGSVLARDSDYTSSSYPRAGGTYTGVPCVVGDTYSLYMWAGAAFTLNGGSTATSFTVTEVPNW